MALRGNLFGGWADTSLRQLVQVRRDVFEQLEFVLVSVIDSSRDVAAMPWARKLDVSGIRQVEIDGPLVLTGLRFAEAATSGEVLFGFDDIWVPSRVPAPAPSEMASIVAPLHLGAEQVPEYVANYVSSTGMRLGLGDGYGLNFVGTDIDLAVALGLR